MIGRSPKESLLHLTHSTVAPPYTAARMLKVQEPAILFIRECLPRLSLSLGRQTSRYSWLYIDAYRKYRMSMASTVASNARLRSQAMTFARTDIAKEAMQSFIQGFTLALQHNSTDGYLDTHSLAGMLDIAPDTMRKWLRGEQAKPYVELNPRKFRITPEDFLKACPILLP